MKLEQQTSPTEQVIKRAEEEAKRLARALGPLRGRWPDDPREQRRAVYALERFTRRMKHLTLELPGPAIRASCQDAIAA